MTAITPPVPAPRAGLLFLVAMALAALFLVSCGKGSEAQAAADKLLNTPPLGLEKAELNVPADNALTVAKVELGKKLFFDSRLSSDGSMQCQSCHLHAYGWTDGKRFSKKVSGKMNTRNSPSLYNVGYQPHYYWDGRAPTMEKNILAAWKGHMGGDPEAMARTLGENDEYRAAFDRAFKEGVSGDNVVKALASFVRSLRAGDSAYDRKELSEAAQRGQEIFVQRCQMCHTPPLFSNYEFYNVGVGEKPDVGRGKTDPNKMGAFKTPSLRNVSKTAPYFHDGSVATLREAVTLMARGGIENEHLDPILKAFKSQPELTDAQIDDLVAFVTSLDSSESFTKPTLPE